MKKLLLTGPLLLSVLTACNQETIFSEQKTSPGNEHYLSLAESKNDLTALLGDLDKAETRNSGSIGRKITSEFTVKVSDGQTRASEDSVALHIFNFNDNQGYAIMSGDNRLPSLIALTEDGSIDPEGENEVNPGLMSFYENLNATINGTTIPTPGGGSGPIPDLPPDIAVDEYYTYGDWENIVYDNGATCPVKWGQLDPYNMVVVEKNDGLPVYAGCVPVAVAQLMAVHHYPFTYNGLNFEWNDMTKVPFAKYCQLPIRNKIALLIEQLGLSHNLDVKYGTEGSSAKPKNITRTFSNFGYSTPGSLISFDSEKLIGELKNGYPAIVGGCCYKKIVEFAGVTFKTTYEGGHCWLAHGLLERRREVQKHDKKGDVIYSYYQSTYYPRYNWGYDGKYDGYFLPTVFNKFESSFDDDTRSTEGEYGNYQYETQIVIGIRK